MSFVWYVSIIFWCILINKTDFKRSPDRYVKIRTIWVLGWVGCCCSADILSNLAPVRRLSVQSYKQTLSIYHAGTLVVSPKTFRNIMVSPQNCHSPCSGTKSSTRWAGAGRPDFSETRFLHKLPVCRMCDCDSLQLSIYYQNIVEYGSRTGFTMRYQCSDTDISTNSLEILLQNSSKQRFGLKSTFRRLCVSRGLEILERWQWFRWILILIDITMYFLSQKTHHPSGKLSGGLA